MTMDYHWKSMMFPMFMIFLILLAGSCFDQKYSKDTDDGKIIPPNPGKMSEEQLENYIYATNPEIEKELSDIHKEMKKELGVTERSVPPPPPGWNLEDALSKNDRRPKIYRWIDENGTIQITKEKPPKDANIMGWRYADLPTPTPTPSAAGRPIQILDDGNPLYSPTVNDSKSRETGAGDN